MAVPTITSVLRRSETEYTVKKSRFITTLLPITDEKEASAYLEKLRKQYWDANHHCYAYRIGPEGQLQKSSDDGEPSGTAGRPILEVLKRQGLTNTLAVVTRYFGGIKLGASGLIRAYGHAVSLALETADIADYCLYDTMSIHVTYPFVSTLERLAPEYGAHVAGRDFSDIVRFTLDVPQEQTARFQAALTEATNGTAQHHILTTKTIPVLRKK